MSVEEVKLARHICITNTKVASARCRGLQGRDIRPALKFSLPPHRETRAGGDKMVRARGLKFA
jgi:hypothetical protein